MKPLVFISHITEEAEVAKALKGLIEPHFLGLLEVFVSSDGESIKMGQKWLDTVAAASKRCALQIVVCSPKSVTRPWVNFEAGAAWIRDVPVIPLCHSGMTPSQLPIPLSLLQAATLADVAGMNLVIPVLAQALSATTPKVDLTAFAERIRAFEERYTFWDECNAAFRVIAGAHPRIIPMLSSHSCLDMNLPERNIIAIENVVPFLQSKELLRFHRVGRSTTMHPGGEFHGCKLLKLAKLDATIASPHFNQASQQRNSPRENPLPDWLIKPCAG